MELNGLSCHDLLTKTMTQSLGFDKNRDYNEWRREVKDKLTDLIGLDRIKANKEPNPKFEIVETVQKDGYKRIKFLFESEKATVVSCYILIPDDIKEKRPVVITLQGHSTGFHNSVGIAKYPGDENGFPRTEFAVQSVKEGYVTLAIEQRGMGERSSYNSEGRRTQLNPAPNGAVCYYDSMVAILLGRTLIGERVFDISCAIDMLSHFSEYCDMDKIVITGNSGGGTASFYAACFDERIKICAPSCAFCPYPESILKFYHCSCNHIPNAFRYFDMQDLSCLIAPRKLTIVAGEKDPSFLIEGVERGYKTVKQIYEKAGAKDNCNLIKTPMGHWWCVDIMWPEIKRLLSTL